MKSHIIRWYAVLTLTGGAFWGGNLPARALPDAEVAAILRTVPVFVLADNRNNMVLASRPGTAAYQIRLHLSVTTAREDLARLQRDRPQESKRIRVATLPMSEAYRIAKAQSLQPNGPSFRFIPDRGRVADATELLQARGETQTLRDVPLFVATTADGSYLPVSLQPNQPPRIPFFFDLDQVEDLLKQLRRESPELAENVKIQVVSLGSFITTLSESDDTALRSVYLFPSEEVLELQRQQQR